MRRQLAAFGVALAVMVLCFAPGALCAALVKGVPSILQHESASHHASHQALPHRAAQAKSH